MTGRDHRSKSDLRDYVTVIRRRKAAIILAALLVEVAALTTAYLKTPVYQATAEVLLQTGISETLFSNNVSPRDPARAVQTEIRVLKSQPVRAIVQEQLGVAPSVRATPVEDADVIRINARSTNAAQAAAIANTYANAYIDFRRKQAVDGLLAAADQIGKTISELDNKIASGPAPERDTLIQSRGTFQQQLEQLRLDAALKTGGTVLVTGAAPPSSPVEPKPVRSAVLGGLVGLMLGIGLAFLVEYLDDSVKTKEDLERTVPGVPVIGLIPAIPSWKDKDDALVISLTDPRSQAAEAYRTLRTSIQFLALDQPVRTLQVTSANAREGKTTTLANLGVALARAGQRVAIVCCDLRRPRVHEFFGLGNETGLTSVLLGKVPLTGALQEVADQNRLFVLASGPLPPNPSELLSSKRTVEVLTSLQAEADIVLLDSPPVLPVTDALVLSGRVDATLLVTVAGSTTIKEATRAAELLRQVDAPLVGTVLNGVDADSSYGYGQYYRYEQSTSGREAAKKT